MFFLLNRQKDLDKILDENYRNYVINKLTCEIAPGCGFYEFYEWYIFQ